MAGAVWQEGEVVAVGFVGDALSPFFLHDPASEAARSTLAAIRSLDVAQAAVEWPFVADAEAEACLRAMQDELSVRSDEDLSWEYRRLFVGPAAKAAPPWGSVYTDRDCVVFGKSTLDLRAWMRKNGIAFKGPVGAPEDHIGIELALMAWLVRNDPACADEYLSDHLLPWASHFFDVVAEQTRFPFYEGLARLAKASLAGVQEARGLDVATPRFYR